MRGPRVSNVAQDPLRAGSTAFRAAPGGAREASNDANASAESRPPHVTSFTSSYDANARRGPISLRRRNNLIYGACAIALMTGIAAKSAFDHLSGPNLNTEDVQDVERAVDAPTPSPTLSPTNTLMAAARLSATTTQGVISTSDTHNPTANAPLLPNASAQPTDIAPVLTDPSQSEAIAGDANTIPPISHRCLAHPHWTGCRAMREAHQRAMNAAMLADNDETVLDLPDTDAHTLAGNDTWTPTHKHWRATRHARHWVVSDGHH